MTIHTEGRVIIPLNKKKLWLLLLGAIAFTAAGVWMAVHPLELNQGRFRNGTFNAIMGGLGAVFFGVCAWFIGQKIRTDEPGLIIEPGGFMDKSSASMYKAVVSYSSRSETRPTTCCVPAAWRRKRWS